MADQYLEKQNRARESLKRKQTGQISYIPMVIGANDWDPKTEGTPIPLDAVAFGVSAKYVSDLISQSDIEVTAAVFSEIPTIDGIISTDGINRQIVKVAQIPAAGTPVIWQIFVKG